MSNEDDKKLIQAVGKVTIYSAYIEENIVDLINYISVYINRKDDILKYRLSDQVDYLIKLFKREIDGAIKLSAEDRRDILAILKEVKKMANERNNIIHSIIKEYPNGKIVQKNPKTNISKEIESKDVKPLADQLLALNKKTKWVRVHLEISYFNKI